MGKEGKERARRGLLLTADDLAKGMLVTIHHWLDGREGGMGIAHRVLAVNLPYLVALPLHEPQAGPVTLDVRRIRLMQVSAEYARAQTCRTPRPNPPTYDESIPF